MIVCKGVLDGKENIFVLFYEFYESIDDCDELPKCDCNDLNVDLIILNYFYNEFYNLILINNFVHI